MLTLKSVKDKSKPKNTTYFNTNSLKKNTIVDKSFSEDRIDKKNYVSIFNSPISLENNILVKINEFLYHNGEPDEVINFSVDSDELEAQQEINQGVYKLGGVAVFFSNARDYVDFAQLAPDPGKCPDCDILEEWSETWLTCLASCEGQFVYGYPVDYRGMSCGEAASKTTTGETYTQAGFSIINEGKFSVKGLVSCAEGWVASYSKSFPWELDTCDLELTSPYITVNEDCTQTFTGGDGWSIGSGKGHPWLPHTITIAKAGSTYSVPRMPSNLFQGPPFYRPDAWPPTQTLSGIAKAVVFPATPPMRGIRGRDNGKTATLVRFSWYDNTGRMRYSQTTALRSANHFKTCDLIFYVGVQSNYLGVGFNESYPVAIMQYNQAYLSSFVAGVS